MCTQQEAYRRSFVFEPRRPVRFSRSNTVRRRIRENTGYRFRHTGSQCSDFPMSGARAFRLHNSSYTSCFRISSVKSVFIYYNCNRLYYYCQYLLQYKARRCRCNEKGITLLRLYLFSKSKFYHKITMFTKIKISYISK